MSAAVASSSAVAPSVADVLGATIGATAAEGAPDDDDDWLAVFLRTMAAM